MQREREQGGPDSSELPDQAGPDAIRPADPSGLGRPLVHGEDVGGERQRSDESGRRKPARTSGAAKKGKSGPSTKAMKGIRRKRKLGPRGRQLARVDRQERGKQRTAGVAPARRKGVNPRAKAKPLKGSPKAKRRIGNRGRRAAVTSQK